MTSLELAGYEERRKGKDAHRGSYSTLIKHHMLCEHQSCLKLSPETCEVPFIISLVVYSLLNSLE